MRTMLMLLAGCMAACAIVMYMRDPERARGKLAQARHKAEELAGKSRDLISEKVDEMSSRAHDLMAEARTAGEDMAADITQGISEVKSEMAKQA